MAASSPPLLIDGIASLLDDVASMTKIAARQGVAAADDVATMTQLAAKKTAGVQGDNLALNAQQQVTGVKADCELPVVWAVVQGSLLNKAILVPTALGISAVAPWAITPLRMLGGLFLCFEGAEKLLHAFFHSKAKHASHRAARPQVMAYEQVDFFGGRRDPSAQDFSDRARHRAIHPRHGLGWCGAEQRRERLDWPADQHGGGGAGAGGQATAAQGLAHRAVKSARDTVRCLKPAGARRWLGYSAAA